MSSDLPSYNPSLPFLLRALCHLKRGSNDHLTYDMSLHYSMSELVLMFHPEVVLSNEMGQ
jgi:hypothetical protein